MSFSVNAIELREAITAASVQIKIKQQIIFAQTHILSFVLSHLFFAIYRCGFRRKKRLGHI